MGRWSTALFADDVALDVKREYGALLSVGKSSNEAEEILTSYYKDILGCNDRDEPVFWFSLAYAQWKKGRLSESVKENALTFIRTGGDLKHWSVAYDPSNNPKDYDKRAKVLRDLEKMLTSPMPEAKKIKKPTVHHCPYKVGSLLAYRIASSKHIKEHPCFGKYALLRVIRINRHPITKLAPNEFYNESMLVGLYGWIGSEIPDPEIVKTLEYIPVEDFMPEPPKRQPDDALFEGLDEKTKADFIRSLDDLFYKRKIKTCACLDWTPIKGYPTDILTLLDVQENFVPSDFFNFSVTSYSLTHFLPFDVTLSKRLEPYLDA
ncbi:MAG: hypothetical protein IJX08_03690 [Clostridia bacterium]|nr:hypothetical protein [Clostridia bacterium]